MNDRPSHVTHIVQINMNLLGATGLALAARLSWPDSLEWWGLGIVSVFCAMAACALLVSAARLMVRIYRQDRAVAAFLAQGQEPKASVLVSSRGLREAGMCDE